MSTPPVGIIQDHGIGAKTDLTNDGPPNESAGKTLTTSQPNSSALDIYSDESTVDNIEGEILKIRTNNTKVQKILQLNNFMKYLKSHLKAKEKQC